jgi:dipeptidyl aminopeptidase/acylaminoacyl peptidase
LLRARIQQVQKYDRLRGIESKRLARHLSDGRVVDLVSEGSNQISTLYVTSKGQKSRVVLDSPFISDPKDIALSPDEKYLYYISLNSGVARVLAQPLAGGEARPLGSVSTLETTLISGKNGTVISLSRDGGFLRVSEHSWSKEGVPVLRAIATVPVPRQNLKYRAAVSGDRALIFVDDARQGPFTGTDYLRVVKVDISNGKVESDRRFENFVLSLNGDSFGHQSVSSKGVLVALKSASDMQSRSNLYLLPPDGPLELVSESAIDGVWTRSGDIVVNRGQHAQSSQILVLAGKNYKTKSELPQEEGFKTSIETVGEEIYYINLQRLAPPQGVRVDLAGTSSTTLWSGQLPALPAELPISQRIEYPSGDRRLPGFLHLPPSMKEGRCTKETPKRPAIVYVHGSNEIGTGGDRSPHHAVDAMAMSQAGFVVLEASYQGDAYLGSEYKRDPIQFAERDWKVNALEDVVAAGIFAKSLPCVDPSKVIYFGHSEGAYTGALAATTPEALKKNPFSAFVFRGGIYKQAEIERTWEQTGSKRLAVAGTDEDRLVGLKDAKQRAAENGCFKVVIPEIELVGLESALKVLDLLKRNDPDVYGVPYTMPESFYDRIVPLRRAPKATSVPIYIMHGMDDDPKGNGAEEFEKALRANGKSVMSWYPKGQGHVFEDEGQIEMVERLARLASSLPVVVPE